MRKGLPAKLALTDADDTRYDFRNDITCNLDGTPRSGLTSPIATALVGGSATMNVTVGAFNAIAARDSGAIKLANDGVINVLISTAPVSNSRYTVVCARQDDASATVTVPDADNIAKVYTIDGAPLASPVKPTVPDGSVELATILVTAGNTNTNAMTITQTAQYTANSGGVVPFRTKALLDAWTTPSRVGQLADVLQDTTAALNGQYRWTGAKWLALPITARAQVTRATDFALTAGTFVAVPFDSAPVLDGLAWVIGTPTRITCVKAGVYYVAVNNVQVNSTGNGDIQVRINGTNPLTPFQSVANAAGAAVHTFIIPVTLAAGDYLEVMARTSGGSFPWIAANRVNVGILTLL